jgi:hypothetical protein
MLMMASQSSLTTASSVGKWPRPLNDLAELVVQRFDAVSGVEQLPDGGGKGQERGELVPGDLPDPGGRRTRRGVSKADAAGNPPQLLRIGCTT